MDNYCLQANTMDYEVQMNDECQTAHDSGKKLLSHNTFICGIGSSAVVKQTTCGTRGIYRGKVGVGTKR